MKKNTQGNKRFAVFLNPFLIMALFVWIVAAIYIQFFADLSLLRYGDQEPWINRLLQVGVLAFSVFMLFLAKRAGIKPIDHSSNLGISRKNALLETLWLVIYMFVFMAIGYAFNIHSHIHIAAFSDGTQSILNLEPLYSTLVWTAYNFIVFAVIPLGYFWGVRNYSTRSLLFGFPNPKIFVPFALFTGLLGVVPIITPEVLASPIGAHLLSFVVYTLGAVIPVAIFTQSLLAPRLAIVSKSWLAGCVLAGFAYAGFNLNEYFLEWDSPEKIGLSLITLIAGDFAWGILKALATLSLGNAWMHIFTTHTFHYAEGATVAEVFGLS